MTVVVGIRGPVGPGTVHRRFEDSFADIAVLELQFGRERCVGIELPESLLSRRNVDAHYVRKLFRRVDRQVRARSDPRGFELFGA